MEHWAVPEWVLNKCGHHCPQLTLVLWPSLPLRKEAWGSWGIACGGENCPVCGPGDLLCPSAVGPWVCLGPRPRWHLPLRAQ
jgi:hypothetical protein